MKLVDIDHSVGVGRWRDEGAAEEGVRCVYNLSRSSCCQYVPDHGPSGRNTYHCACVDEQFEVVRRFAQDESRD